MCHTLRSSLANCEECIGNFLNLNRTGAGINQPLFASKDELDTRMLRLNKGRWYMFE